MPTCDLCKRETNSLRERKMYTGQLTRYRGQSSYGSQLSDIQQHEFSICSNCIKLGKVIDIALIGLLASMILGVVVWFVNDPHPPIQSFYIFIGVILVWGLVGAALLNFRLDNRLQRLALRARGIKGYKALTEYAYKTFEKYGGGF